MTNNWMIRGLFLAAALAFTACPSSNKCTTNADCKTGEMCSVASGTCVTGTGTGGGFGGGGGGISGGGGGTTGGGGGSTTGGGGGTTGGGGGTTGGGTGGGDNDGGMGGNETCASAQSLTLGTMASGTTATATDDYDGSGTDCDGSDAADLAYSVTVPAGQVLTVVVTPESSFDPVVAVSEDAASCNVTCLDAIDNGASGGAETYQYRNTTGGAKTLFFVVDGYNGDTGSFTILATAITPQVDDVCSGAVALTAGTPLTAQAITGYTNDYTTGTGCAAASGPDRAYSIAVPAGQRLTVTVTPTAMANPSVSIVADAAACGTTCVAGANSTGNGVAERLSYVNRTGGNANFLVVVDFTSTSAGTFDIVAALDTPPMDDVCENPTVLTANAAAVAGTTVGYTNDYVVTADQVGCADTGGLEGDRVYSIAIPNGQRGTVTVTPSSADAGFNPSINIVDSPAATCSAMPRTCVTGSNAAGPNAAETVGVSNVSGGAKTFFAIVDSSTAPNAYTIGFTTAAVPADDTCTTNATTITSGQVATGNLTGFGSDYASGTNCFGAGGPDRVYRAQLGVDQKLSLNLAPTGVDGGFDGVINFIPGPAANCESAMRTCQGGIDFTLRNQVETGGFTNNTGAAMDLFVVVADYELDSTSRDFSLTGTIAAAPAGESCRVPQALTAGVLAAQNLVGASADVTFASTAMGCTPANLIPDRVYSATVPNGQTLTVALTAATAADFAINIIDAPAASCSNVTACVETADAVGAATTAETATWQNTSGAAKTVFVHVTRSPDSQTAAELTAVYTLTTTIQ